jgi:hypothetical protein
MYLLNDVRRGAGLPTLPLQATNPRACDPPAGRWFAARRRRYVCVVEFRRCGICRGFVAALT